MAAPRSHWFNADLDPDLLRSMEAAAGGYKPNKVELRSGYRPGDKRFHGKRKAIDVQLYDAQGRPLDSYQGGGAAKVYQDFANYWYKSLSPEQQKLARWGGYFGDPTQAGYGRKYGDQDYMHFDFGGDTVGMLGGSWATGFKPEAMKILGLTQAGGIEAAIAAGYTPEQIKAAFLSSIASTESPGYDVLYGGGKFTDYSRHPNQAIPIESGPNKGKTSTAAGRYQFLADTWEEQSKLSGVTDFSAASQDRVAWDYADRIYKAKTGGSLLEALQSNDPARMNAAASILSGVWTSLPGGIEQSKGYGGKTFADVFKGYLGNAGTPVADTGGGTTSPYALPKPEKKDNALASMAKAAMSGLNAGTANWQMPETPPTPAAARVDAPAVPTIDPQQSEYRRALLAQAMARLNQGSLV